MKWVIQSKDRTQYVGKNLFDICENADDARKFNSKFEAEQFLDKHAKTLISGYWKVIAMGGVEEKKTLRERGRYDYDHYDILSMLSKYADYKEYDLDSVGNTVYKIMWKKLYDENECNAWAKGMEEIYDIKFSKDLSKMYISKDVPKSVFDEKKSLKERDDTIFSKDVKRWMLSGNDINITFKDGNELVGAIYEHRKDSEDKKAECFLCEDLTSDYTGDYFIVEVYNGKISEIKFQSYDWLEHYMDDSYDLMESKKSTRKSLKESTDEDFSLYDLNKHDPFVKEWIKNINKELKDVSIDSIGDDEIVFRVWFDENIDLDIFDDIVTDCMPRTLIEFMSDMNIDFGYQFVYEDDKFTENDYVFIRFVAW